MQSKPFTYISSEVSGENNKKEIAITDEYSTIMLETAKLKLKRERDVDSLISEYLGENLKFEIQ